MVGRIFRKFRNLRNIGGLAIFQLRQLLWPTIPDYFSAGYIVLLAQVFELAFVLLLADFASRVPALQNLLSG